MSTNDLENSLTNTCPICFENISENMILTNCSHSYCKTCFDTLLDRGNFICPMCRQNIKSYNDEKNLYRIVIKEKNETVNRNITLTQIIEELLKVNRRLKCTLWLGLISFIAYREYITTLFTVMQQNYDDCQTNLNKSQTDYNICLNYRDYLFDKFNINQ